MKTAELEGFWLHYAVGKAEGFTDMLVSQHPLHQAVRRYNPSWTDAPYMDWEPAANWAQGGPILDRERIGLYRNTYGEWLAGDLYPWPGSGGEYEIETHGHVGPTALIAAMRAFVASKLGEELELP